MCNSEIRARANEKRVRLWEVAEYLKHGDKRLHHHMIVPYIERAEELFKSMWRYGAADVERVNANDIQPLAKYFTKEAREDSRKVGERAWTPSKGLRKPTKEVMTVPDNCGIEPPEGSIRLDGYAYSSEYGKAETVFYRLPERRCEC